MGASLWDKLVLPLLIGVASPILVAALCFLSVRLRNFFMKLIKTRTAVVRSAHDQPLPGGDAVAHAHGVRDLETGNGHGFAQGGESMAEREMELGVVNGDQGIEQFSDQETRTPVTKSPATASKVTKVAVRRDLVRPVDMDPPDSQQVEL